MGKYDDIINLPHHVSPNRTPMPIANRAAQFAPFAALAGHEEAIAETMRVTDALKELSDDEIDRLSRKLCLAIERRLPVSITFFIPDKIKSGGSFRNVYGTIKKWDEYANSLIMADGTIILINSISEIRLKNNDPER